MLGGSAWFWLGALCGVLVAWAVLRVLLRGLMALEGRWWRARGVYDEGCGCSECSGVVDLRDAP